MLRSIAALLMLFCCAGAVAKAPAVDPAALNKLIERAKATHTDALVVMHDGKLVGAWNFTGNAAPMRLMSIAKSVCALAVGELIDSGKVRLDQTMADFVPEWRNDSRARVKVRDVLAMTTGLGDPYSQYFTLDRDLEHLAMAEPLVRPPGTEWRYNNTSVNLVDVLVRASTGENVEALLTRTLFAPLGIAPQWVHDSAGNVPCAAGLSLLPVDLARIGEVLVDGGYAAGRRVLSARTVDLLTRPSQTLEPRYGLLWWVVYSRGGRTIDGATYERWKAAGVRPDIVRKLRPMVGRVYPDDAFNDRLREAMAPLRVEELDLELRRTNSPGERFIAAGVPDAAWALGDRGQKLYVSRSQRLVVVRLIAPSHWRSSDDDFFDFLRRVRALVGAV